MGRREGDPAMGRREGARPLIGARVPGHFQKPNIAAGLGSHGPRVRPLLFGYWQCEGRRHVDGRVSRIRTMTTTPDAAVIAATSQIAARIPAASATTPATIAPIANPRSRHSR